MQNGEDDNDFLAELRDMTAARNVPKTIGERERLIETSLV